MQLSTDQRSAIIDPLPISTPASLGRLLEDPTVEVVFHDADYDLRLLHQDYGWLVTNIFDTRIAAQLLGFPAFGLAALLEKYFHLKLDKKHQRADWSMRPLTADMLEYAAQDTRHLLELRDILRHELERKDRWSWAAEEFQRLEGTRWPSDESSTAFLRLKGARDLARRELARLRELLAWRDTVAGQLDRATFRVVSNEVLLAMAKGPASTRQDLAAVKGMPRGMLDRQSAEMLVAVALGDAVPEAELPRFPKPPRWDKDPAFDDKVSKLRGVRDDAAKRLQVDPGVLCSRERMEAVARRAPQDLEALAEVKELRRWQVAELGEVFVRAMQGAQPSPSQDQALREASRAAPADTPEAALASGDSPYRDG